MSDVQVVGLADTSSAVREAQSREHHLPAFPSHLELIEKAHPDYLVIGTPHYSHTEIAMDAMRRGVHAFVEKPLAVSAARAEECVAVARQTGRVLGVNFLRRLQPAERKLHDLIESGFLGRTLRVTMVCTAGSGPWLTIAPAPGGRPGRAKAAASPSTSRRTISTCSTGPSACPRRSSRKSTPPGTRSRSRTTSSAP